MISMDVSLPPMHTPRKAMAAHVAPYLLWIVFIMVFKTAEFIGMPFPRSWIPSSYAVKSVICAALLLVFRPWQYYKGINRCPLCRCPIGFKCNGIVFGVLAGLLVAFLWIFPETPFFHSHCRWFCDMYNKWLIMPLGAFPDYYAPLIFPSLPEGHPSLAYSVKEAGMGLAIAKIAGSAFVIAAAEEYFFRGFLYRWLRKNDFLSLDVSGWDAQTFWIIVAVFALEHDRWFMGAVAGVVYGMIMLRTGGVRAAVVSHMTTNLALGIYVVVSGQYGFW